MTRSIWIKNVPDSLHRTLGEWAAAAGQSLSDYLLVEISRLAKRPTLTEVLVRASGRSGGTSVESIVEAVHEGR